ncbi:MAG: hypothetical protein ACOVN5_04480, partial [Aquidulcibacter sp.]
MALSIQNRECRVWLSGFLVRLATTVPLGVSSTSGVIFFARFLSRDCRTFVEEASWPRGGPSAACKPAASGLSA